MSDLSMFPSWGPVEIPLQLHRLIFVWGVTLTEIWKFSDLGSWGHHILELVESAMSSGVGWKWWGGGRIWEHLCVVFWGNAEKDLALLPPHIFVLITHFSLASRRCLSCALERICVWRGLLSVRSCPGQKPSWEEFHTATAWSVLKYSMGTTADELGVQLLNGSLPWRRITQEDPEKGFN